MWLVSPGVCWSSARRDDSLKAHLERREIFASISPRPGLAVSLLAELSPESCWKHA